MGTKNTKIESLDILRRRIENAINAHLSSNPKTTNYEIIGTLDVIKMDAYTNSIEDEDEDVINR